MCRSFTQVQEFLIKQTHRPFLKRYLRREEILRQLQGCDKSLGDALGMFGVRFLLPPLPLRAGD